MLGVFYNKSLVGAAGITKPPATLAEFEQNLSAVKNAGTSLSLATWQGQGKDPGSIEAAPQLPADGFTPGSNAVDRGRNVGLTFCGTAPDIGAVETGC